MPKNPNTRCMHCEKPCNIRRMPVYLSCDHFFCTKCSHDPNISNDCRLCPLDMADRVGNIVRKRHDDVRKREKKEKKVEKMEESKNSDANKILEADGWGHDVKVEKLEVDRAVEVKELEVNKGFKASGWKHDKEVKTSRLEVDKGYTARGWKVDEEVKVDVDNKREPSGTPYVAASSWEEPSRTLYVPPSAWEDDESITNTQSISTICSSMKLRLKTATQAQEPPDRVASLEESYKALTTFNLCNVLDFKVNALLGGNKLPEIPIRKMLEAATSEKQWEETFNKIVNFLQDMTNKRFECEEMVRGMMSVWLDTYNEMCDMIDEEVDPDGSHWGSTITEESEYEDEEDDEDDEDEYEEKKEEIHKLVEENDTANAGVAAAAAGGVVSVHLVPPEDFDWNQPTTSNCPYYVDHTITSDSALPSSSYSTIPTSSSYSQEIIQ